MMNTRFADALREAEEEQVLDACRGMRLDRDMAAYVIARNRSRPGLLDEILTMGGDVFDYVRMVVEARPPSFPPPLPPTRRRHR